MQDFPSHPSLREGLCTRCIDTAIALWILLCACSLGRPRFEQNDSSQSENHHQIPGARRPIQACCWLEWDANR